MEMGVDSLLAVEVRNALGKEVGQRLSAGLIFDYPTLDQIVTYLLDEILQLELTESPQGPAKPDEVIAEEALVADMSEEEVGQLLDEELKDYF